MRLENIDCMDLFKTINNNSIDLIVCDPPYKITARGNTTHGGWLGTKKGLQGTIFDYNDVDCKDWFPECYRVLKNGGHAYIMCNHVNLYKFLTVAKECGFHFIKSLIWNKGNKVAGMFYMNSFEYILFFRKGKAVKINNCGTADVLNVPNVKLKDKEGKNLHSTSKPVELMKILIENSSKIGEIVLDFAFGIGTTAIACKELGRDFVGAEIDEKYFNIAKERLETTDIELEKNVIV